MLRPIAALALLAGPTVVHAQDLLVVESNFETVLLISHVDGTILNPVFINLNKSTGSAPKTPTQAIPVGAEIWITDQGAGAVFRFDQQGNYLGEFGVSRTGNGGIALANGRAWVTHAGAPYGTALKEFDLGGNLLAVHDTSPLTTPSAVIPHQGNLLVSDVDGDDIDIYDLDGEYVTKFHDSDGVTGIDSPMQLTRRTSNANFLAAGLESPAGIYEYSPTGAQVGYIDTTALGYSGPHAVRELENGNYLFTNKDGIHVYDTATGQVSTCFGGVVAWYISELHPPDAWVYCDEQQNPNNASDIAIDTTDASAPSITLSMSNGPINMFVFLAVGDGNGTISQPPGNEGDLCIVGGSCLGRYSLDIGNTRGTGTFQVDIKNALSTPCNGGVDIQPGSTWYFQFWHRQSMGQPSRFSAALGVTFK